MPMHTAQRLPPICVWAVCSTSVALHRLVHKPEQDLLWLSGTCGISIFRHGKQGDDVPDWQAHGFMVAMLRGVECPLDCDVLVFPMPVEEQWACAVLDMRHHNITYCSSFMVFALGHSEILMYATGLASCA